jgi:hypothetical protein
MQKTTIPGKKAGNIWIVRPPTDILAYLGKEQK